MDVETISDFAGQLVDMFRNGLYEEVVNTLVKENNCLLVAYVFYYLEEPCHSQLVHILEKHYPIDNYKNPHKTHCNQGEYVDSCKYGEFETCSELN